MKKAGIIFLVLAASLLLPSCNSREAVKHMRQMDMINYVKAAIGEDISLVGVDGDNDNNVMTYEFKLDERDITFEVSSVINAPSIDGARFGNYSEKIYIMYAYISSITFLSIS